MANTLGIDITNRAEFVVVKHRGTPVQWYDFATVDGPGVITLVRGPVYRTLGTGGADDVLSIVVKLRGGETVEIPYGLLGAQ